MCRMRDLRETVKKLKVFSFGFVYDGWHSSLKPTLFALITGRKYVDTGDKWGGEEGKEERTNLDYKSRY